MKPAACESPRARLKEGARSWRERHRAGLEKARKALKIPRVGERPGRDLTIDALRGYTILLVVFAHAISVAENLRTASPETLMFSIHRLIYLFQMPRFFAICGYVLFGRRIRISDRALRLLLPYAAWIPIYYLMNRYLLHWRVPFTTVLKNVFAGNVAGVGAVCGSFRRSSSARLSLYR